MRHPMTRFAPLTAMAALALAACGDDDAGVNTADANLAVPPVTPDMVVVYPAGTEGSLETNAMRAEVERLRGDTGAQTMPNQAGGETSGGNQTATAGGQNGGAASGETAAGFSGLDRDSDNRLSPAEYAIHALPAETPAQQGATNDENPPYVSDEALNSVATSFRRLDTNGDFFLSEEEFQAAAR